MNASQPARGDAYAAAATAAYRAGHLDESLNQLAAALALDPERSEWLSLVDEVLGTSSDPLMLIASNSDQSFFGQIAVRARAFALAGALDQAIALLLELAAFRPAIAYLSWVSGWLRDHGDKPLPLEHIGPCLARFVGQLRPMRGADDPRRRNAEDALALVRRLRQAHPDQARLPAFEVTLLRQLGRLQEALEVAQRRQEQAPTQLSHLELGWVYQALGQAEKALEQFQHALQHGPNALTPDLAMGHLLLEEARFAEAQDVFARVAAHSPQHPAAEALSHYAHYMASGDEVAHQKLQQIAQATAPPPPPDPVDDPMALSSEERQQRAEADTAEAQRLSMLGNRQQQAGRLLAELEVLDTAFRRPAGKVAHAAASALQKIAEGSQRGQGRLHQVSVHAPLAGPPSAGLAFEMGLSMLEEEGHLAVIAESSGDHSDTATDFVLWREEDGKPVPALPAPPPQVGAAIGDLASRPFSLSEWEDHARGIARQLKPLDTTQIAAQMVHPFNMVQPDFHPLDWIYRQQVAVALVLGYLDEGWAGSRRRAALMSLVHGANDWSVAAALVALAHVARQEPEAASELAQLYPELATALDRGEWAHGETLLLCWMKLPDLEDETRREVWKRWKRLQTPGA